MSGMRWYNLDDGESCGLCGSSLLDVETIDDRADLLPPPNRGAPKILPEERKSVEVGLIALVIGGFLSIAGLLVAADLVLGSEYRLLGLQLTVFGLITIMAVILGTFGGLFTGWRGWYSQMIERDRRGMNPKSIRNPDEKTKRLTRTHLPR